MIRTCTCTDVTAVFRQYLYTMFTTPSNKMSAKGQTDHISLPVKILIDVICDQNITSTYWIIYTYTRMCEH